MRKICCFIFISFSIFLIESCKETPVNPEQNYNGLYSINEPLSKGNRWSYLFTEFDEYGNIISTDKIFSEIKRDTLIQGKKWFIKHSTDKNSSWVTILRNENNELLEWNSFSSSVSRVLKYPPLTSDTFHITSHVVRNGINFPYTYYKSIDTRRIEVTVPKGKFYACKVSNSRFVFSFRFESGSVFVVIPAYETYYTIIGMIKSIGYEVDSNNKPYKRRQLELIDYNVR